MAYTTLDDVRALISKHTQTTDIGDANSAMSEVEADSIVANVQDEIDTLLSSQGVVVSVAAPTHFLGKLKLLNGYGAAARILKSILPDVVGPGETPAYMYWEGLYREGKKSIQDGTGIPGDAVMVGGNANAAGSTATHLTDFPDENPEQGVNARPRFEKWKVW